MSLLTVTDVSKSYFGRMVLDHVSVLLDRGDRLALIGNNGAGKTTLLRLILGQESPDTGTITLAGSVIPAYLPQELPDNADTDLTLASPELQMLEDQLREAEAAMTKVSSLAADDPAFKRCMADYAALTDRFNALGGYDYRHRMQDILAGLGLGQDVTARPLGTLSGGERMRIALARLMLLEPDLLLLDEPTNHMDLAAMEFLEHFLSRFRGAVLLISHDRTFIDRTATAVAELAGGSLTIRPGNYSRFQEQAAAWQHTLEREIKKVSRELERQQAVAQTMLSHRNMSAYHARERVAGKLSAQLGEIRERARRYDQKMSFRFLPGLTTGDPDKVLLETEDLAAGYDGDPLVEHVSFTLRGQSKTCLCGPNGCGKTTLLQVIQGFLPALSGQIRLSGQATFGRMGQHVQFTDESLTVLDELTSRSGLAEGQARDLLARYGFRDVDVFKQLQVLSGGERSRLYLACLLLEQPNILFLDEPTNHLDIQSREILERALLEYNGAILAVSHDRTFIDHCCNRVLGFIDGHVYSFDTFEAYRQTARQMEARSRVPDSPPDLPPAAPEQPVSSQPDTRLDGRPGAEQSARRANRVQERRDVARRKDQVRSLEQDIARLEQEKTDLEGSFQVQAGPACYERYAAVLVELDLLYGQYLELAGQDNDS